MPVWNGSIPVTEFVIGGFETTKLPLLIGVVILIIYVLSVLGNMMNILLIIFDRKLHKPMYLLICNLAVVDILYTSSASPTMIGVLLAGADTVSYVSCLVQMFVYHVCCVMEWFALAVMAFDRLLAIGCPFQYHSYLTNVRALLLLLFLWASACAFVATLPVTLVPLPHCSSKLKYKFCDYPGLIRTTCVDPTYYFNLVSLISFFLLFFTFSLICLSYLGIFIFVKISTSDDKRKLGSTCVSHLIVVSIYYGPMFVCIILTRIGLVLTFEVRDGLTIATIFASPLLNPVVYCFKTKEIRWKIFKMFKIAETWQ